MAINPLSYADLEGDDSSNNQRNNIGGAGGTGAAGSQISSGESGSFNTGSGVGGSSGGQSTASKPSTSGSFTNLQNYVNANADQSQGIGGKIAGNIQNEANTGFSQLGSAQNQYDSDVDTAAGGNVNTQLGNVQNDLYNAYTNPGSSSTTSGQAGTYNPSDLTNYGLEEQAFNPNGGTPTTTTTNGTTTTNYTSPDSSYTNAAGNTVDIPKDLTAESNYGTAINTLQNATNDAQNTQTDSGKQELLQQAYSRPTYSQGQQQLDNLLLSGNSANNQQFQTLQNNLLGTTAQQAAQTASYNPTSSTGSGTTVAGGTSTIIPTTNNQALTGDIANQEQTAQQNAANYLQGTAQNLNNGYNQIQAYLNGGTNATDGGTITDSQGNKLDVGNSGLVGLTNQDLAADNVAAQGQQQAAIRAAEQTAENQYVANSAGNPNVYQFTTSQLDPYYTNPGNVTYTSNPSFLNDASVQDVARVNALNSLVAAPNVTPTANQWNGVTVGSGFDPNSSFNFNSQQAAQQLQNAFGGTTNGVPNPRQPGAPNYKLPEPGYVTTGSSPIAIKGNPLASTGNFVL